MILYSIDGKIHFPLSASLVARFLLHLLFGYNFVFRAVSIFLHMLVNVTNGLVLKFFNKIEQVFQFFKDDIGKI